MAALHGIEKYVHHRCMIRGECAARKPLPLGIAAGSVC